MSLGDVKLEFFDVTMRSSADALAFPSLPIAQGQSRCLFSVNWVAYIESLPNKDTGMSKSKLISKTSCSRLRTQVLISVAMATLVGSVSAQNNVDLPVPDRAETYKKVGDVELKLHIFEPARNIKRTGSAIVFFFGGGWVGGSPSQFFPQCRHLADRGMVAMSAEYRIRSKHETTPFECVRDGKSAVRWIRVHANELGINSERIAAGGGSAGGHVAACTALIQGMDDEQGVVSSTPNALVLFNPVIDTSKFGFGNEQLGIDTKSFRH